MAMMAITTRSSISVKPLILLTRTRLMEALLDEKGNSKYVASGRNLQPGRLSTCQLEGFQFVGSLVNFDAQAGAQGQGVLFRQELSQVGIFVVGIDRFGPGDRH